MDQSPVKEDFNEARHMDILRPYDSSATCVLCGCCCLRGNNELWQQTLKDRMRLVNDIKSGSVSKQDAEYVEKLIEKAWILHQELEKADGSDSVDEEELINKVRLKVRFEDIQIELKRFEDPYLRMFARRDLLNPDPLDSL